jgi:hypothetical protein
MGLRDQHALVHAHHAPRLAQDHFDQPRVLGEPGAIASAIAEGSTSASFTSRPSAFENDLLADHQQIAGRHRRALAPGGLDDQPRDVVARPHFADAGDGR